MPMKNEMATTKVVPGLLDGRSVTIVSLMRTELVTMLKRQATRILSALAEEKVPVLITEHGRPAAYLVDVQTFERQQARMQILEGIARGENAIREGRSCSQEQARKRMKRWAN